MKRSYALLLTIFLALVSSLPVAYGQQEIPVRVTMSEDFMSRAQAWDWAHWIESNIDSELRNLGGCGSVALKTDIIEETGENSFSLKIAGRAYCTKIGSLRGTFYLSRPWFYGDATGVIDFAVTGDNGRQPVRYRVTGHY